MWERVVVVIGACPIAINIRTWSFETRGIESPTECRFRLIEDSIVEPSGNGPFRRITTSNVCLEFEAGRELVLVDTDSRMQAIEFIPLEDLSFIVNQRVTAGDGQSII